MMMMGDVSYYLILSLKILTKLLAYYAAIAMMGGATMAVLQEAKLWSTSATPSLSVLGIAKVYVYNIVWFILCFLGAASVFLQYLFFTHDRDLLEFNSNYYAEAFVAGCITKWFVGHVELHGEEHLAPVKPGAPAPVYIANHASQLDVALVYYIHRRFKWIAKRSILYLPGVGQIMWTGGHVLIQRSSKKKNKNNGGESGSKKDDNTKTKSNASSVSNLFQKSNAAVQSGVPMFFFPQGTRRFAAPPLPFKEGAFILSQTNNAPLIPISIDIPSDNPWNALYPLFGPTPIIKIIVHKPILPQQYESREALKQACFDQIFSALHVPALKGGGGNTAVSSEAAQSNGITPARRKKDEKES